MNLTYDIPRNIDPVSFRWPGVDLSMAFSGPVIATSSSAGKWQHEKREVQQRKLGGCWGENTIDTFRGRVLTLIREIWVATKNERMAIRQTVINRHEEAIELDEVSPLLCEGAESLSIDGCAAGQWELLRQGRLKNAVPSAVRLGYFDTAYQQACNELGESGESEPAGDGYPRHIMFDSFGVFRSNESDSDTHLLFGFLSQRAHLAQFEIATDAAREQLTQLTARCLFDHCVLPPDGMRKSQWVLVQRGDDPEELIDEFADGVGRYHSVNIPDERPPAVWCSWYYYGPYFYEEQLHEELAYLKKRPLPFDVILIDDSRPGRSWGDWYCHARWPAGMKDAADRIRKLGYRAGIWTCPFLAKTDSKLAEEYPHWLLRKDNGEPVIFKMDGSSYVLDTTYPGVVSFIEELFRVMTEDWGFTYHKLDFLRSILIDPGAQFYDRSATRLEAYERGLAAVRRGAGPNAYISVCGGHYGGSLGLADAQRSGSDVEAQWDNPPALPKFKQNLLRTWMNRLWHTDADAMMVRRRSVPINDTPRGQLSLGMFTDEEAQTIAANQYVGGGMVCGTEHFAEIDEDRLALYRHVIPPASGTRGIPLDSFNNVCPSQIVNRIKPRCPGLAPWVTVTLFNWEDQPASQYIVLTSKVLRNLRGTKVFVFEFFEQKPLGLFDHGDTISVNNIPPHGCRVLRIASWDGEQPILAGTDLHMSGGGVEVSSWEAEETSVSGEIDTQWDYPVHVSVAFPAHKTFTLYTGTVQKGERFFEITEQ